MSVRDKVRRLIGLTVLLTCLFGPISIAFGQLTNESIALDSLGRSALQTGVRLERSGQWLEAIEHYEKSLESWSESSKLKYGLRRSKIHFGIARRYSDSSFERTLVTKSRRDALTLFDDVLGQVRAQFVEPISSTSFVAHGTESLYLAMASEKFVAAHLRGVDSDRIKRFRSILREQYWNKRVAHRAAARQTVEEVCNLASSTVGLSSGAVVMEYIFGGCNALDDYSNVLTPDRLEDLYGNIEGEFVGLGIEMKSEMGQGLLLVNVLPESPAEAGGLLAGDHIVAIDDRDCRNMTTDDAARMLRGEPNSRVRLAVESLDNAEVRSNWFTRRAVKLKSIPVAKMIDKENGIAYIRMTAFQKTTASELDTALANLRRQGMRALIWDLRGNPGGLLTAAVEILDRFIDEGVLVSTKGRNRDQNYVYSAHRVGTSNVPIVLLVDGNSASASEIVAGAIRDHHRGTIVGRKTFGKWSVQSIFPQRASTGFRLTTAKFYSPDGHTLGKIGVKPDIVIEAPPKRQTFFRGNPDPDSDADLRAGRDVLRRQLGVK